MTAGDRCRHLTARRPGLTPDLPCGVTARHEHEGVPLCLRHWRMRAERETRGRRTARLVAGLEAVEHLAGGDVTADAERFGAEHPVHEALAWLRRQIEQKRGGR